MKQSILFCAVYLGRISFAFTTGASSSSSSLERRDFNDHYSVLAQRQAALANVQRRHVGDLTDLPVRNLLFPRTGSGRGSPPREGGGKEGKGGGGSQPPGLGGSPPPGLGKGLGPIRVGSGRVSLERTSSLGSPRPGSPSQRSPPSSLSRGEPLPPDAAKAHLKMHGPGTYGFTSGGPSHRVDAGRKIHKGTSSGDTLHAVAIPYDGGKSTISMTGSRVEGNIEAVSGHGTGILQTHGRNVGETKIVLPGQHARIAAEAAPGETVGVKVKAHGPLITGATAHPERRKRSVVVDDYDEY